MSKFEVDRQTLYRFREAIKRLFITDINNPAASALGQSQPATTWETVSQNIDEYNHLPGGSNVLYLAGHVEFLRYPNGFPVSEKLACIMGAAISMQRTTVRNIAEIN